MENSKSNEDCNNQSTLSDDDKPPSPKITLLEKHDVKLENRKMKERQESKIQPDLPKKQREAADGPSNLTEQQRLLKGDSSKDLLHGESREKFCPDSTAAPDLTKEQTGAADTQRTEEYCYARKNSMIGEFLNGKHPGKNVQENNTPADLVKEQTEATGILAEEPEPHLQIQNDSVKGELPTDDSPEMIGQDSKSEADLKEERNKDSFGLHRIPEKNRQGHGNNLEELPVMKSLESNYLEIENSNRNKVRSKYAYANGSPKEHSHTYEDLTKTGCLEKNDQINTTNLTKGQPETDEFFNKIPKQHCLTLEDSLKELFILPDFRPFEPVDDFWEFQELITSDSSKRFPPVYSLSTGSVAKKDPICTCSEVYKIQYPNECPTKLSKMPSLAFLDCFQPLQKETRDGYIFDKESKVETAAQSFKDLYSDESEDETDSQPINLKGFSKEYYDELFSKLQIPDASSETDDNTVSEPLYLQSPSSEVSRPIFPIPTLLADLSKKDGAHNQSKVPQLYSSDFLYWKDDDEETQREDHRVRELFRNNPDYPLDSPPKHARIPSPSFSDGLRAFSGYGRYVRMSPTDVVSLKLNHFGVLTSLRNELLRYSSSIKRNDGAFVDRFVRKLASSALETFATFADEMKKKVEDDINFYNDNYIIDTMRIENK